MRVLIFSGEMVLIYATTYVSITYRYRHWFPNTD